MGVGESKEEREVEETVHNIMTIIILGAKIFRSGNERKGVEKEAMIATYFNALTPIRSSDEDCADNCSSNIF